MREHQIEKDNYYQWFKKLRPQHPEWADLSKDPQYHERRKKARRQDSAPNTEVQEKAKRRQFSAKEKERILAEIDKAEPGEIAAILRREGIYTSHIQKWQADREQGLLAPRKRGPKPNPSLEEVRRLRAQLAETEKKLAQANALIDLQKK
ncbi:MAG TPA: transposase [Oculatellaceae cyanobacterium]